MRRCVVLLVVGILVAGGALRPVTSRAMTAQMQHDRARAAYGAMQGHFAVNDGALYREHAAALPSDALYREQFAMQPGDDRYAFSWPFGQAFTATLSLALLRGQDQELLGRARLLGQSYFDNYWDSGSGTPGGACYPVTAGGGVKFYDDNIWIGLNLAQIFRLTGDGRARDDAVRVFDFLISGWDGDPTHPAPGGIFWTQSPDNHTRDRNTVSNAPTIQLALHLYSITGEQHYLDWARRIYDWTEQTMRDPEDGLYWDRIQLDGWIEKTKWSYNQGAMLGAAALFYSYTGDSAYLERGKQIAAAALAYYGAEDRLWAQDPAFNAIFFTNLLLLARIANDDIGFVGPLALYAERAWTQGRDEGTGIFHFGRGGPAMLLTQTAAVQLFTVLAAVAPEAGTIAPGAYVAVAAGREGANIRELPGIGARRIRTIPDGATFIVTGPSLQVDGHTWWPVAGEAGRGWIAGALLAARP